MSLNKSLYHLSQAQVYIALTRKNTKDQVRKVDRQWYELMLGDSGQNCLRSQGILVDLEPYDIQIIRHSENRFQRCWYCEPHLLWH